MGQSYGCCTGCSACDLNRRHNCVGITCGGCTVIQAEDFHNTPLELQKSKVKPESWLDNYGCSRLPFGEAGGNLDSLGNLCASDTPGLEEALRTSRRPFGVKFPRHRLFAKHVQCELKDFYRLDEKIGSGTYGNVFQAFARPRAGWDDKAPSSSHTENGMLAPANCQVASGMAALEPGGEARCVAVKVFDLAVSISGDPGRAQRVRDSRQTSFEVETALMAHMDHPHIVRMYECFREKDTLYTVLELCRGGEVYEQIVKANSSGGLGEPVVRHLFRQMLAATAYLHFERIVHRDLKTENFLVLGGNVSPDQWVVKLCDFGTAVRLTNEHPRAMDRIGTLSYTAPEIYLDQGADVAADVWSLGVVLYILVTGANPFRQTSSGGNSAEATMYRILKGDFDQQRSAWTRCSESARELVHKLLVVDEFSRLPTHSVMLHPWLTPLLGGDCKRSDLSVAAQTTFELLRRFSRLDVLQQLAIIVCARLTPQEDILHRSLSMPWYDLFFSLDADRDGRLSLTEFAQGFESLLPSLQDLEAGGEPAGNRPGLLNTLGDLGTALDLDGSGAIEWAEWTALAVLDNVERLTASQEPFETAFRALDGASGDGIIKHEDLAALLSAKLPGSFSSDIALDLLRQWTLPMPGAGGRPAICSPCSNQQGTSSSEEIPTVERAWLRQALKDLRPSNDAVGRHGEASQTLGVPEREAHADASAATTP